MSRQPDSLAVIDLGTYRCCCLVADVTEPDRLEVVGIGSARTGGVRRGVIVNLEAVAGSLRECIEQAAEMSGRDIDAVLVTVPGAQVRSFTSRGVVSIGARNRLVSQNDLKRVLATAQAVQIPDNQATLHVLPQEYTLDGQDGIQDPVGMTGSRLEVSVHIVTVPTQVAQHVTSAVERSGVQVVGLTLPALAGAESVLTAEDREQGVFLIDIGGATTDIALFERGALWFTNSVPSAGDFVTSDIGVGLRTPIADAEHIKRTYARAVFDDEEDMPIDVPSLGGGPPRVVSSGLLGQIVAPRVQEIFELVRERIERSGLAGRAAAGAVLVGGSANLEGIAEVAEDVLGLPVRVGMPEGAAGLVEDLRAPSFATPLGLALWELRNNGRRRMTQRPQSGVMDQVRSVFGRTSSWFSKMF